MSLTAPPPAAQTVVTPTIRRTARRFAFWGAALVFLLIVVLATIALTGASPDKDRLSPASPVPAGAKAVAEVLRQNGVTVTYATSLDEVTAAAGSPDQTTLAVYDPNTILSAAQYTSLRDRAASIVLLDPGFASLTALLPTVGQAGEVSGTVTSAASGAEGEACTTPTATRAPEISSDGSGFRLIDAFGSSFDTDSTPEYSVCYGSGDGVFSLIRVTTGDSAISAVGATDAFTNDAVALHDNAAFALGTLGERPNLVWYLPTLADSALDVPPTLAELSPDWLIPTIALVVLTFLAAAFWRGRRFGSLVVENLPVVVRASETMEGRARLYERGSARLRALDSLRIGAIDRLAVLCGLPRLATVDEIVATAASRTNRPIDEIRDLLVNARPMTDRALVQLSDQLLELERAVAAATRPA